MKIIISNFNENNLKFKKYNHDDKKFIYSENNIIYFSESLLNEPENKIEIFCFLKTFRIK